MPIRFVAIALWSAILLLVSHLPAANAAQQVTLRNGTTVVATSVKLNGETLEIQVDEQSTLSVPLAQVVSIASADLEDKNNAQRLLLAAFETRLLTDNKSDGLGLFSEAYRQAPNDPHVAFWYARTLLESGKGKAAAAVLEKHRQAIGDALPEHTETLLQKLAARVELEELPAQLLALIDQASATAANTVTRGVNNRLPTYSYFRLLDQHGEPIDQSYFQISSNGSDEQVTSCGEGYYFYSYSISPSYNSNTPHCTVRVGHVEVKPKEFKFSGSFTKAANAGTFAVRRFEETDKKSIVLTIVDPTGEAIDGAKVTLSGQRSGNSRQQQTAVADESGVVRLSCFPTSYTLYVNATGYKSERIPLTVGPEAEGVTKKIPMHKGITAALRVAWKSQAAQNNPQDRQAAGESLLRIVAGNAVRDRMWPPWMQVQQVKDQLVVIIVNHGHHPGVDKRATWTRVVTEDADEDEPLTYEKLDIEKLGDYQDKYQDVKKIAALRTSYQMSSSFQVKPKQLYFGQLANAMGRANNKLTYKIKVESFRSGTDN